MNLFSKHFLIAFVILLTSCSVATPIVDITQASSPSATPIIVSTTTLPVMTNAPTPIVVQDLTQLKSECKNINTKDDLAVSWVDRLVLKDSLVLNDKGQTYILNLETGRKTTVSNSSIPYTQFVSPDRSKLTYENVSGTINITDNNGELLHQISNSDKTIHIVDWLDNEALIAERWGQTETGLFEATLIIINTNTDSIQEFPTDFPDMRYTPNEFLWTLSLLIPNSKLTHLIYPTWKQGFALWDLNTNKAIKQIPWVVPYTEPQWSPNGDEFVQNVPLRETYKGSLIGQQDISFIHFDDGLPYVGGSDILSVDLNGEINRLTFFTTKYHSDQKSITWSPNGEMIAFWLYLSEGDIPQLSTLDLQSGFVTNHCISPSTNSYSYPRIIWSPDGSQLTFTQGTPEQNAIIIDLKKDVAFYITEGVDVVGWMSNNP